MRGSDHTPLEITILSDPANLAEVRQAVEHYALGAGLNEAEAAKVVLALDEALTNIIRHAYGNANDRPIEIQACHDIETFCLILRDYGRQAPRETIHSRNLDDVRPGGLGVHIMTTCMDCIDYQPADDTGTVLTMTKRIAQPRPGEP